MSSRRLLTDAPFWQNAPSGFMSSSSMHVVGWALGLGLILAVSRPGRCQDHQSSTEATLQPAAPDASRDESGPAKWVGPSRSTTIAFELGLSWLALPVANICDQAQCVRGDGSPLVELWGLVRPHRRWAWGAGASLGFLPTNNVAQEDDDPSVSSRSYMLFEAVGRYYPVIRTNLQWWFGPGAGLALLGDRFMSQELVHNRYERVGDPGVQLVTEGLSLFLGTGLSHNLTEAFRLGAGLRAGGLFFPKSPKTTPLGDRASLTGTTLYLAGGIVLALATPL